VNVPDLVDRIEEQEVQGIKVRCASDASFAEITSTAFMGQCVLMDEAWKSRAGVPWPLLLSWSNSSHSWDNSAGGEGCCFGLSRLDP